MSNVLGLEEEITLALRRIARATDLHSRLLLGLHGLTAPQLLTLQGIARLQPVNVGALARAVRVSQATATGILDRLHDRGFVTRTRGGRDRRQVVVELTEAGVRMVAAAPSLLQGRFRAELARLPRWEQTMILATLQRIATMMDAETVDGEPALAADAPHAAPPADIGVCLGEDPPAGEDEP